MQILPLDAKENRKNRSSAAFRMNSKLWAICTDSEGIGDFFFLEESTGSGAGAAALGHTVSAAGQEGDCEKLPLDPGWVTFCD